MTWDNWQISSDVPKNQGETMEKDYWPSYSTYLALGFSFVFHDKGKRTQHGNLLEMMEKDDWPGREFSR